MPPMCFVTPFSFIIISINFFTQNSRISRDKFPFMYDISLNINFNVFYALLIEFEEYGIY